jgi:hypothetical protein
VKYLKVLTADSYFAGKSIDFFVVDANKLKALRADS